MLGNDLSKRIYGLDIMRCIAIMLVVIQHSHLYINNSEVNKATQFISHIDGVDIFFVLSGFLIGQILIRTFGNDKIKFRDLLQFWTNRWFRTLPLYYFILIILIILGGATDLKNQLGAYFLFLQNFFWGTFPFFGESWSLAVEEWFYFLIPLSLFILRYKKVSLRKSIILVITGVLLISFFARIIKLTSINIDHFDLFFWNKAINFVVLTRLDCILLGVLGAYIMKTRPEMWKNKKNKFAIIGLVLLVAQYTLYFYSWNCENNFGKIYLSLFATTIRCTPYLFMLPFFHQLTTGKGIIYQTVSYISVVSYSLYLVNLTFTGLIFERITLPAFLEDYQWILYMIFIFAVSTITYKLIEQPSLKLRGVFNKRFFEKK